MILDLVSLLQRYSDILMVEAVVTKATFNSIFNKLHCLKKCLYSFTERKLKA